MNVKKKCFDYSKSNTRLLAFLTAHYKGQAESALVKEIHKLQEIDTIQDVSSLIDFRKRAETDQLSFSSRDINRTNFRLYGIGSALFGETREKIYLTPSIEHGLILQDRNWSDTADTARASCITFGPFRKAILRRYYKTPVFEVGPYIQYAAPYYDETRFQEWKNQMGRTLLVFPSHGTDQTGVTFDEALYVKKIESLAQSFDSVLVCAFWWNVSDRLIRMFSEAGYRITCAGFREDPNFLRRLKTIIQVSDEMVCDSVGTHVGYGFSMGKRIRMLTADTRYTGELPLNIRFSEEQKNRIRRAVTEAGTRDISDVFDYYWGNHIRLSEKERDDILEINKRITLRGRYWTKNYAKEAGRLLSDYEKNDASKYRLLLKALT